MAAEASSPRKGLDMVGFQHYIDAKGVLNDAMRAVVDERKLTEYVLNPRSKDGKHKAYVFDRVLGITAENTEDVRQQILEGVQRFKAVHAGETKHGSRFTVFMPINGPKGTAVVKTAWLQDDKGDLRLTSMMVAEEKEQEIYKHLLEGGE
jgi:hypothetical protein